MFCNRADAITKYLKSNESFARLRGTPLGYGVRAVLFTLVWAINGTGRYVYGLETIYRAGISWINMRGAHSVSREPLQSPGSKRSKN